LIEPHKGDKRSVRRNQKEQFMTEVSAGRSLAIDRPHKAKNEASASRGDCKGKRSKPISSRLPQGYKGHLT